MRRRSIPAMVALALAAGACSADDPALEPTDAPAASAPCSAVEHPPEESGGHLLPGATPPVPYGTRPPTSGWHASGLVSPGVHAEPLTEPQQVTVLEGGRIVVSWRELADADRVELEAFTGIHANRVVSAPYDGIEPGQVVFTAWGVLQRCRGFDPRAALSFLDGFAGRGPAH
jgi:hypothetical protein